MYGLRSRSAVACALSLALAVPFCRAQQADAPAQGVFRGSTDIGHAQPGSTIYEAAKGAYKVSGGGQDVWGAADDFRFTWTKVSGNAALSAQVDVTQPSTYPKAKGMLMFRESLDPGSPYADVAIHADGHITLQWRKIQGGPTQDIDLPEHGATHLRIVRKGDTFTAYVLSAEGETANPPSITIAMPGMIYAGIGACSHDTQALQTVIFSEVSLKEQR